MGLYIWFKFNIYILINFYFILNNMKILYVLKWINNIFKPIFKKILYIIKIKFQSYIWWIYGENHFYYYVKNLKKKKTCVLIFLNRH